MSSSMVGWGGLAGLAAAAVFLVSGILTFITPPEEAPSSMSEYLIEVVVVVAFVLTLLTIAGVHAAQRHSGRYGLLGAAGFWMTFLGYVIVFAIVWGLIGYALLSRSGTVAEQPSRVS